MKIVFIGCGNIAHFHADALVAAGASITACAFRSNLNRALDFKNKYGLRNIFADWNEMIISENPDAIWVCASWENSDKLLMPVTTTGLPVFFEKPVALSSDTISRTIKEYPDALGRIQVGFNRRFYSIVQKLKSFLKEKEIINVEVFIPENVNKGDRNMLKYRMIQNSSHIFDLVSYILDDFDIQIESVHKYPFAKNVSTGLMIFGKTTSGCSIYFSSIYNSPLNTTIRFYTADEYIYELRPIERLTVYKGFDVIEPGVTNPIRLYNPRQIISEYETGNGFKPGFFEQASAFLNGTFYGNNSGVPTLSEACRITIMIEKIMKWAVL